MFIIVRPLLDKISVLLGSAFGIVPNLTTSINVHGAFPKILH